MAELRRFVVERSEIIILDESQGSIPIKSNRTSIPLRMPVLSNTPNKIRSQQQIFHFTKLIKQHPPTHHNLINLLIQS
jgi:hypothetical protein